MPFALCRYDIKSTDVLKNLTELRTWQGSTSTWDDVQGWWKLHHVDHTGDATAIPVNTFPAKSLLFFNSMFDITFVMSYKLIIDATNVLLVIIKTLEHMRYMTA